MADEIKTPETSTDNQQTQAAEQPKQQEIDYKAEYEKLLAEQKKLKDATDKACSQAADFKRKLSEKMSEQERAEAERAEKEAATLAELEKYRTESRINGYKTKLLECGYDLKTAESMAGALPEGINDDFFANQKAFLDGQKKTIEAELLNKQPGLSNGKGLTQSDVDDADVKAFRAAFGLK